MLFGNRGTDVTKFTKDDLEENEKGYVCMHGGAGGVTEGFAAQLGTVTVTNEALEVTYNDSIRSKANYAFVVM